MKGPSFMMRSLKRATPILVLIALAAPVCVLPASAQDYQTRELIERLNRLERDLGEVQRQFYKGDVPSPSTGAPSSSGGGLTSTQAADLSVRINQLETELRTVTGSVEKVDFEISRVRTRLDKLVADVDFRLTAIERQLAAGNKMTQQPPGGSAASAGQGGQAAALAPATTASPQAGTLGTLPADSSGRAAVAVPESILPAGGTEEEHYDVAFQLIRQGDYGDAERAFREFLAIHGDSKLAGNAQYWLAESFYVRGKYDQAARGFLEGYQKYKGHDKALGSLLKLGMSLVKLEQRKEACATFDQLTAEFPNAADHIKRQVTTERARIGCK
jgi:tol-pal system protein YbgF